MRPFLRIVGLVIATGCGAPNGRPPAAPPPREPAAEALELEVRQSSSDAQRITLELTNRGAEAIGFSAARARIELRHPEGGPLRECSATPREYRPLTDEPEILKPGQARRFDVELPCTPTTAGDYALVAELVLGDSDDPYRTSPLDEHLATTTTLRLAPPSTAEEAPT